MPLGQFWFFSKKEHRKAVKKDVIYSMRMNKGVREALRKAAHRECRTVASLLDKIIADYLAKEGFALREGFMEERRKYPRKETTLLATTHLQTGDRVETLAGVILDISLGGVLVSYPKGSKFKITSLGQLPHFSLSLHLPNLDEMVHLDCDARRILDNGNQIQVGAIFREMNESTEQKLRAYLS